MDCINCGGKMTKLKYLHYEELEDYLLHEHKSGNIEQYEKWLTSLKENDAVLTLFQREDFFEIKKKYYLRVVEKKTKSGIKLRGLSRLFKYESGEITYGKEGKFSPVTTYKIYPIDERIDNIIRDYCKNREQFDIDKLNRLITNAGVT